MSPVRIIQITDMHLSVPAAPLRGMDQTTEESLLEVLKYVETAEKDLILCTGDLAETPDEKTYQRLVELLSPLDTPIYCLPGNHDDPETAEISCIDTRLSWDKTIELENWVILMLDSFLRDVTHGELGSDELEFLESKLKQYPGKHILICLHHHPVETGSSWMDEIMLADGTEFLDIIDQYSHIRAVLWGHIHQEFDELRDQIRMLGTPSTCRQFKPDEHQFLLDKSNPGFRELILNTNGTVNTKIFRC